MLALALLLAISLVTLRYRQVTRDNEALFAQRANERAKALAGLFSDTIGATLRQAGALHDLARLLTEAQLDDDAEKVAQLRLMLNPVSGISGPDVAQVAAIGADGRLLWSNLDWSTPPTDLSDREHFRVFQRDSSATTYFSSPVTGRTSGERTVQYARAVRDREGRLKAVTVLSLRVGMLTRLSDKIDLAAEDIVELLRDDGLHLMRSAASKPVNIMVPTTQHDAVAESRVRLAATPGPLDHVSHYMSMHPIPDHNLTLHFGISRAAQARALAGIADTLWRQTLFVDASILAIAIAAGGILLALQRARDNAARAAASMHNEVWFRSVINEMADGVLVIDDLNRWDSGINFANRRAAEMFGVAAEELVGRAVQTLATAEEQVRLEAIRERLLRGQVVFEEIYRAAPLNRDRLWIAVSAVTTMDILHGIKMGAIFTLRDVTEEQVRAKELADARERIDRMLKVIPGMFYNYQSRNDGTLRNGYVSDGVKVVFGVEPAVALQADFLSKRAEIDLVASRAAALRRVGPNGVATLDYWVRHDGRRIWLRDTMRLVSSDDGTTELAGFLFDYTAEHEVALARQAADEEVKKLNWALNAYSRSLAVLLRAGPLQELMEQVCAEIVIEPHYALACIAIPRQTANKAVWIRAAAGPKKAYIEDLQITWDEQKRSGSGPTGRALRSGQVLVVDDTTAEEFAPWRAQAMLYGIRSLVILPFKANGAVIGALSVYGLESGQFQRSAIEVFARLAEEVGLAITIEQGRERLRIAEQSLQDSARLGPGLLYRARLLPDRIEVRDVVGEADRVIGEVAGAGGGPATLADIIGSVEPLAAIRALAGKGSRSEDFAVVGVDGTARWIRNSVRIVDRQEDATELVGYLLEVTREKQQQLQRQQFTTLLTLGEMATGLAHELSQPLAAINFTAQNAELMLDCTPPDVSGAIQKIQKINRLIDRAAGLIDHMRIFARNEHQTAQPLSWADSLNSALDIVHPKLLGCEIRRAIPPDLPDVMGLPIPMEQILINLLSNAADAYATARPDCPRLIEVIAMARDDQVVLRVKDHAGGIPLGVLPRIWEPFYTTKAPGSGTGLGLSLVFGAVVDMGGSIKATNEDDGAVFEVTLPAAV